MASQDLATVHAFENTLVNVDLKNVSTQNKSNKLLYITLQLILKYNAVHTAQHQAVSGKSGRYGSVYLYHRMLWVENYVTTDIGDLVWKRIL